MVINEPFFALVALILFFALVLYLRVPKMIAGILDQRAAGIRDELDKAAKLRTEAEELLAEYKRKAAAAEREAADIVRQAEREAEAMTAEAARRAEEYVANRTRLAEQKIAQAEAQALADVKATAADVAVAAAEKLLAGRVKGETADALIAKAIGSVKAKLH
jgi:F-type H+-transporting ATPase subunit b